MLAAQQTDQLILEQQTALEARRRLGAPRHHQIELAKIQVFPGKPFRNGADIH